jgi:hypothetical protein
VNAPSPLPEPFRRARRATMITAGAATGVAALFAVVFAQPEPARAAAPVDAAPPAASPRAASPAAPQQAPAPRHSSRTNVPAPAPTPQPQVQRPHVSSGPPVVTSGAT